MRLVCTAIITLTLAGVAFSQDRKNNPSSPGTDASSRDMSHAAPPSSVMKDMPGMDADTSAGAVHSMEGHHMDMGPHMKMTALRAPKAGDEERAQSVVAAARQVSEKYKDYHTALADGFKIFLPNVPQKMYHFTSYKYAFEAVFTFNPDHPTSLLYEKQGDAYKLVGVMYTAPKRFHEDDLDKRIPLSIGQWHEHVNLCMPPADRKPEALGPKFGLHGSIATQAECDANGGTFHPIVFNWMVHLYPLEKTEAEIWDVTRGAGHNHAD
jgi:hypothetical protein